MNKRRTFYWRLEFSESEQKSFTKVNSEDMSAKESMTTQARLLVQDQNLNIHKRGGAARLRSDGSKAQKKPGVGVRKALANITNSEKPSSHQELKKNQLKKSAANGNHVGVPKAIKEERYKSAANGNHTGVPKAIEEERCLHNHQCCINLQTRASTMHPLKSIVTFNNEKSPLVLWSPKTPSTLNKSKVDLASTPTYLDFTQSPVSLKIRSSVNRSMLWSPFSPSVHQD